MIDANDGYGPAPTRTGVRWRRRLPGRAAIATTAALIAGGVLATPTKAAADPAEFVAVYSWGNNPVGQLGDGTEDPRLEPGPVGLPEGVLITKIEAEAYGSMALTADGQVYGWGTNQSWQLAIGGPVDGSVPVLLDLDQPEGTRFTDIAAGYSGHRLALTSSGTVIAWGADQEGEACNGSDTDHSLYDPVVAQLPSGVHATAVAAGYDTSFAITSDNRLYAWGGNDDGQLGDGTTHQRTGAGDGGSDGGHQHPVRRSGPALHRRVDHGRHGAGLGQQLLRAARHRQPRRRDPPDPGRGPVAGRRPGGPAGCR